MSAPAFYVITFSCRLLTTHYFPLLSYFLGTSVIWSPLSDWVSSVRRDDHDTTFTLSRGRVFQTQLRYSSLFTYSLAPTS